MLLGQTSQTSLLGMKGDEEPSKRSCFMSHPAHSAWWLALLMSFHRCRCNHESEDRRPGATSLENDAHCTSRLNLSAYTAIQGNICMVCCFPRKGSRVLGTLSTRREANGPSAAAAILHHLWTTTGTWRCFLCRLWHAGERTANGLARPVSCWSAARLSAAPCAGTDARRSTPGFPGCWLWS